ncbi:MAG: hypothetical protein KAI72_03755, partial [Candidatus Pacebacteria bacterium]|nr:hypothetical protein [Candidatus Paceibacterota bacterium]
GLAFRNKSFERTKKEIVIFLTPKILKVGPFETKATSADISDYDRKRDLEAKAKEEDMLNKFSGVQKKEDIRDYTADIDDDKKRSESIFKEARSLEKLAIRVSDERERPLYNKAISYYLQVARDYKGLTKNCPEALFRVGRIYYTDMKRYGDAELIFQEVLNEYPENKYAKKAIRYLKKINKKRAKE